MVPRTIQYKKDQVLLIEIHGEGTKVLNAFDVVVKLLRKFLVHHSMIPYQPSRPASAAVSDYQDPYLLDHGTAVDSKTLRSTLPRYGQDIVKKPLGKCFYPFSFSDHKAYASTAGHKFAEQVGNLLLCKGAEYLKKSLLRLRVPHQRIKQLNTLLRSPLTTTKSQPQECMGRVSLSLVLFHFMETLILHHLRFHIK
uniref:Uncharacterized protein n=1 Tax=Solanum lycopersicum TaxID=4081 RepID=A0A3Q7GH29_SOLLC